MELDSGTVVGKYRISHVLGRGGMAVVYEAAHESLGRQVALKVLSGDLASDPEFVERFRREGRLQASLEHPHVLTVFEAGESEHGLFIAMQLVDGATLAELLREHALDGERALMLLGQVAEALDAAHEVGLVHRDVKPQNVLVAGDHAYLSDFGLTKVGGGSGVTVTGGLVGTLAYLAPEVIRGEPAAAASDRYSFAAMAFECLSGTPVFPRSNDAAVLFAHMSEPPPQITGRRAGLPAALDDRFASGLAKDPRERPGSASDLVAAVREAVGADLSSLGPPPVVEVRAGDETTVEPATPARATSWGPPRVAIAAAAVVLAALGVGVGLALGSGDGDSPAPADEPPPALPEGSIALGSALESGSFDTLDCDGRAPTEDSHACSVAQAELPGRQVVVPRHGVITSWSVRGARGELRLQILRRHGQDYSQIRRSQYQVASDESVHTWPTSLRVQKGDIAAVVLSHGSGIGVHPEVDGATTNRWSEVPNPGIPPTDPPGTGFDHEVLFRVSLDPGGDQYEPPELTGRAAARAPEGLELKRRTLTFPAGGPTVEIALVELDRHIVLDLYRDGERIDRITVPHLLPEGTLVDMYTVVYPDDPREGEVGLTWINLDSARAYEHAFGVFYKRIDYYGE